MMKTLMRISFLLALLFEIFTVAAQQSTPFFTEIQNFKKQDSLYPPPQHEILFVGSSSFTKWKDVQDYFPSIPIINRGFGGSSLPDVIRYASDVIYPYHPKQVLIYCGDNDFAMDKSVTPDTVIARVKTLFRMIRENLPETNITYVSIKPSPSRVRFMPKEEITNKAIKEFLGTQKNAGFIDVYHLMLGQDGKPIPSIFLSDSLHMNAKGYEIWQKAIKPALVN